VYQDDDSITSSVRASESFYTHEIVVHADTKRLSNVIQLHTAITSLFMSVSLSVCVCSSALEGFSLNLIFEYFPKSLEKI